MNDSQRATLNTAQMPACFCRTRVRPTPPSGGPHACDCMMPAVCGVLLL